MTTSTCSTCAGKGYQIVISEEDDTKQLDSLDCPDCNGSGQTEEDN